MESSVTGVVLAAGAAERMGSPKLLLPFGGSTILNATLASVEASDVDRVVVVTGAHASEVESSIIADRASIVRNPDYRRGNMSSFLTAATADPAASAFLLVPGDLPTVQTGIVNQMVVLWRESGPWAAVTSYADGVGHPLLVSRRALDVASRARGEKVLGRILIESNDERVVHMSVPIRAPRDVNTPADYEALKDDER